MTKIILVGGAMLLSTLGLTAGEINIIPQPVKLAEGKGEFKLTNATILSNQADLSNFEVEVLAKMLSKVSGKEIRVAKGKGAISLHLGDVDGGREAYELKSSSDEVKITANSAAGLLYGVQTLSQLIEGDSVPATEIHDYPRFGWRGLHLDVSRHFFDVDFIKRYIDLMVLYKYNVFHWHLSDDDGWRLESKKFPKLTEIGAFRPRVGRGGNQALGLNVDDGKPYGGFYTQEQVKDIIAYAKVRNVDVLPEIDVPGHSKAIIQSYPEFGTHPGSDVLNIGSPKTIKFLEELFSEVSELFPFGYVHIGCDEVGLGAWTRNADCQAKMKELGTDDPHVLHKWLVEYLQKHLAGQQKEAVAWCEVLDAKVEKETVVMAWRDNGGWIKAPKLGHKTVVMPSMQTYFNYQEDIGSNAPGHGGYRTTMQKVYNFDPVDASLTAEEKKLVLGGQGCVWTEFIPLPKHVEFITYPRAAALAEALWSPKQSKDWKAFEQRINQHTSYMDKHNIQYRIAAPIAENKDVSFVDEGIVKFVNPNLQGDIYYTSDGTEPTAASSTYLEGEGVRVKKSCVVKAIVVFDNARESYRVEAKAQKAKAVKGMRVRDAKRGVFYRVFDKQGSQYSELFQAEPRAHGVLKSLKVPKSEIGKDNFVVAYDGLLRVEKDGSYTYRLSADDAAVLYINGQKIADHRNEGAAFLGRGYHPFTLVFREDGGAEKFSVEMRASSGDFSPLDKSHFYHSKSIGYNNLMMVDTDINHSGNNVAANVLDENPKTYFHSNGGVTPENHFTIQMSVPTMLKEIEVLTGKQNGGDSLEGGNLEVSYDGDNFVKLGDFTGGITKGRPSKPVKAIRIQVIRPQANWLLIREVNLTK